MAMLESNMKAQDIIKALKAEKLFDDNNLKRILSAGADVLRKHVRSAYVAAGHSRHADGTFAHIVRPNTLKRDKQDIPYMVVTARGRDDRNQSYNTKAFVLNYGRKRRATWKRRGGAIQADYYWTQAVKSARDVSNAAMREEAIKILNEQGG